MTKNEAIEAARREMASKEFQATGRTMVVFKDPFEEYDPEGWGYCSKESFHILFSPTIIRNFKLVPEEVK